MIEEEMIALNDIVFGFVDNGIMLLGALTGCSIDSKLENKVGNALIGALIGNAISDCLGGFAAMDVSLALGSFIGCLIPLILYIAFKKG